MSRKPAEFQDHPKSFGESAQYRAFCKHVVDGDTMDFLIDLGLNQYTYETVHLEGIDAPEIYRPKDSKELESAREAKSFVEDLILNRPVIIETYKDTQTFGRYRADVLFYKDDEWRSLADALREAGFSK